MKNPKILILGHGRHGKDTVAEIFRDEFGLRFVSSSLFVGEKIMFDIFNSREDLPSYQNFEECYADRHNHRGEWHRQIGAYNSPDKSRIAAEVLEVCDMYVGMRCRHEYEASKKLFDYTFWVDATDRGMPLEGKDSFNIEYDPKTMILIENNGSLENLKERVREWGNSITWPQTLK